MAVVAAEPARTPDIPPYVAACVQYGLALSRQQKQAADKAKAKGKTEPQTKDGGKAMAHKGPSADELVLREMKTKDEREACAKAVLNYYRSIQKANRQASAKPTS